MDPILIGYFPGYPVKRPQWMAASGVEEVCNANRAHFPWPENYTRQNRHNALFKFDSEEMAWTVLQDEIVVILTPDEQSDPPWKVEIMRLPCDEFDLYAYQVWPVCFSHGQPVEQPFAIPQAAPIPGDYIKLGYDVVSWDGKIYFGCCPLFCNNDARFHSVNRYCLLDQKEKAMELARYYSQDTWEPGPHYCGQKDPGPYWVVEIWRKSKPFNPPKRCADPYQWTEETLRHLISHKLTHDERVYRRTS